MAYSHTTANQTQLPKLLPICPPFPLLPLIVVHRCCAQVEVDWWQWRDHFRIVMPSLLAPRAAVAAGGECELLSVKPPTGHDREQRDKLDLVERLSELNALAASYVPPVTVSFGRSASQPTALSSSASFSSVSCLSLVSSFFERSSSFWLSSPRTRHSSSFSAPARRGPPPAAILDDSDDTDSSSESDSDSGSDSDECTEDEAEVIENPFERLSRTVDEVELLEYCGPTTRQQTPSPPLTERSQPAEQHTSRAKAEDHSRAGDSRVDTPSSTNPGTPAFDSGEWLRTWHSELSSHMRQRDAERRKKRRTLRSALLIDDDECCHAQLTDERLTLTTRYRHMLLIVTITMKPTQHPRTDTAADQPGSDLSISADIHLPLLASTFAMFRAQSVQLAQPVKAVFPFGLTQSASFSSSHQPVGRHPLQDTLSPLRPRDHSSHPLARSSSVAQFVQSRLTHSANAFSATLSAPPMLPFIRAQLWPLMLDFMQPATHEQTIPHQAAESDAAEDEARRRQQSEADEARLVEREKRWGDEIQRMEERDRRHSQKENRAVNPDRRRGRQREREKTEERQARPRKRTMDG